MIVDSLANRNAAAEPPLSKEHEGAPLAAGGSRFAALLASTLDGSPASADLGKSAAAAAELLRLDMMRSAFSLGDAEVGAGAPAASRATELVLRSFAENGRKDDAPAAAAPLPAGEARAESVPAHPGTGNWLDDVVQRASRRYGVEVGLIKAVIKAESNFNPNAVSRVGARGLMQLMPATARGLGVADSFDPEQNVMAGTRFLKDLLTRYGGNVDKALAAYNWGPGNVDRKPHLLPRETRDYLVKVKEYYAQYA